MGFIESSISLLFHNIVSNPQVKQMRSYNQVYSMIPSIKLAEYVCEITTGENHVRSKRREREREKESSGFTE